MKLLVALAGLLAALVVAAPSAAFHLPTTGEQISMFSIYTPATYPANEPFYIRHGNVCAVTVPDGGTKAACLDPVTRFELTVDGIPVRTALDLEIDNENGVYTKLHLANFRFGLPAGTHTFVAEWYDETGTVYFSRTNTIVFQ